MPKDSCRLEDRVDREVGADQSREHGADRVGMGHVVSGSSLPAGAVSLDDAGRILGVDHELDRMWEREDEGSIRLQDAMDLPEDPAQVGDGGECVDRDDGVEPVVGQERERRQLAVVELDVHAGVLDRSPGPGDLAGVLVDGDDACAAAGEGDGAAAGAAPENEEAMTADIAEQPPVEAVHVAGPELEGVVGERVAVHSGGRVTGPGSHGRRV